TSALTDSPNRSTFASSVAIFSSTNERMASVRSRPLPLMSSFIAMAVRRASCPVSHYIPGSGMGKGWDFHRRSVEFEEDVREADPRDTQSHSRERDVHRPRVSTKLFNPPPDEQAYQHGDTDENRI